MAATSSVGGMIKRGKAVTTRVTKLKIIFKMVFPIRYFLAIGFMRMFLELDSIR